MAITLKNFCRTDVQSAYQGNFISVILLRSMNNDPEQLRIVFTLVNVTGQSTETFINHVKIAQIRLADNLRRIFEASLARRESQVLSIKNTMEMYREERIENFVRSRPHGLFEQNFRAVKINNIKLSQAFDQEKGDLELMTWGYSGKTFDCGHKRGRGILLKCILVKYTVTVRYGFKCLTIISNDNLTFYVLLLECDSPLQCVRPIF